MTLASIVLQLTDVWYAHACSPFVAIVRGLEPTLI